MTTSNTTSFNLDLSELIEEAYERCGSELRSGYGLKTARRSLNLLTIEWANRGINLWTIEQGSIAMVTGQTSYNLPADTIDLLDHVIRTGSGTTQIDVSIARISSSTYASIAAKNAQGRPVQVWINRQVSIPQVNVWPVPNDPGSQYTLIYWRLRRIQDAGNGVNTPDIPFRFTPALISGLAYYLSMKVPGMDLQRAAALKGDYEEQFQMASEEDRDKASLHLLPRIAR
jgi:hypothetical protein